MQEANEKIVRNSRARLAVHVRFLAFFCAFVALNRFLFDTILWKIKKILTFLDKNVKIMSIVHYIVLKQKMR